MREETDARGGEDLTDAQVASMQVQSATCSRREKKILENARFAREHSTFLH